MFLNVIIYVMVDVVVHYVNSTPEMQDLCPQVSRELSGGRVQLRIVF